jgi:uncharacterized protein YutE (UPF0331/DUF86 family)
LEKSGRVRILSKLDEMIKYVEELQSMLPDQEEYLRDLIRRRACEKTIEVAIESLIDVCAMIVSAQQFGLPETRNILIHRYGHVDDEIVYYNLSSHMNDFYEFETAVELYLQFISQTLP